MILTKVLYIDLNKAIFTFYVSIGLGWLRLIQGYAISLDQDLGAFKIESEADLFKPGGGHGLAEPGTLFAIEHEEAASAGADELAADCTILHGQVVPMVDTLIAHLWRPLFFVFPVQVHQLAESASVAIFKGLLRFTANLLDEVEVGDHGQVFKFAACVLNFENLASRSRIACEEEQQVIFEVVQGGPGNLQGPGFHLTVGQEVKTGDTSKCGNVLILLANWLFQNIKLNLAGLAGQFIRVNHVLFERMKSLEQGCGEAPRGAQAGAGRDVGHAGNFQTCGIGGDQLEGFANERMLDLADFVHFLKLRVFQKDLGDEPIVNGDIDIAINGRSDQKATVLLIIAGQVGASASNRDS